jgi:prepilin-type N-terminal cleavage/methylation domain-containing protein
MRPTQPDPETPVLGNAGFTLLEIIAVIVIMAILAVVAVPRYFDLQAQARQKAMETAMAEAISRVNGYFAQQVLSGVVPQDIDYLTGDPLGSDMGDFTLTVMDGGEGPSQDFDPTVCFNDTNATGVMAGCIKLVVSPKAGTAVAGAEDEVRSLPRPGF